MKTLNFEYLRQLLEAGGIKVETLSQESIDAMAKVADDATADAVPTGRESVAEGRIGDAANADDFGSRVARVLMRSGDVPDRMERKGYTSEYLGMVAEAVRLRVLPLRGWQAWSAWTRSLAGALDKRGWTVAASLTRQECDDADRKAREREELAAGKTPGKRGRKAATDKDAI